MIALGGPTLKLYFPIGSNGYLGVSMIALVGPTLKHALPGRWAVVVVSQ